MRADDHYHLGLPNCKDALPPMSENISPELAAMMPKYSPYIIVDHKHGLKPDESRMTPQLFRDQEREEKSYEQKVLMQMLSNSASKLTAFHLGGSVSPSVDDVFTKSQDSIGQSPNLSPRPSEENGVAPETEDCSLNISDIPDVEVTHLSLTQAAMIVIVALKKEKGK